METQNQTPQEFAQRIVKINELYKEALKKRYVTSKGEFATFVGVTFPTMSSALNGSEKYLSEALIIKAENALRMRDYAEGLPVDEKNLDEDIKTEEDVNPAINEEDVNNENAYAIIRDVCACVQTMCDTLNKERESHERIVLQMLEAFKR